MSNLNKREPNHHKQKENLYSDSQADKEVGEAQIQEEEVEKGSGITNLTEDKEATILFKGTSNKTILFSIVVAVAVLLSIIFNVFWGQDTKELLAQAEESVQSVYLNHEHSYLKENLTQEDLNEVEQIVNKLNRLNRQPYLALLKSAQIKFDSVNQLNTIYQSDQLLINGDQRVSLDQLVLHQYTSVEVIEMKAQSLSDQEPDTMVKELHHYYQHAIETLEQIADLRELVTALAKTVRTRTELVEAVTMITEIEPRIEPLMQHPQMMEVYQRLQAFSDTVVEFLIEDAEPNEYDLDLINVMNESKLLSKSLIGTIFGEGPLIALTFDDGPNARYTPQVLDILAKHDIKAAFFVRGDYVDKYPEITERIVKEGHIIGNHTYNHYDLSELSDKEVQKQFELTQEAIRKATGVTPDVYRLPFGLGGKRVIDLMPDMTSVLWNVDSADWISKDTEIIYDTIMNRLQYQTLLLLHDTHQAAPDLIDILIPELKEKGYSFVSPEKIEFDMQYFGE